MTNLANFSDLEARGGSPQRPHCSSPKYHVIPHARS